MLHNKKILALLVLAGMVLAGVAAVGKPKGPHKNLKVLPQDISEKMLDSIMNSYNKALGIGCSFCHSPQKDFPDNLDYAADENPMKEEARKMMRMTIHLNKTYFHYDTTKRPEYLTVVTCQTCHRGEPYPEH